MKGESSSSLLARQLSTGRLRVKKRYSVFLKHGTSTWFLAYTLAGQGRFGHTDGEFLVKAGDMVLIRPNIPHDYGTESHFLHWELLWAHFIPHPDWFPLWNGETRFPV
jgi:AraC family transcriptional regulator of arabinose operon